MADINIQRKKSAPSPWLLVLLAAVLLAGGAYFFLRTGPADEPAPPAGTAVSGAVDAPPAADTSARRTLAAATRANDSVAAAAPPESASDAAAALISQAATDPAAPDYALNGLRKLAGQLVALTDRDDLRDPTTTEQRDNLTSATSRLGEPGASLRPGFVAAAGLIRAMQQKAYPELETAANDLVGLAGQLSGRSVTTADQQQNQQFLTQAAAAVQVLSAPK